MTFQIDYSMCTCGESEEDHCAVCETCPHERPKGCCMEGWPQHLKDAENAYWDRKEGK